MNNVSPSQNLISEVAKQAAVSAKTAAHTDVKAAPRTSEHGPAVKIDLSHSAKAIVATHDTPAAKPDSTPHQTAKSSRHTT